MRLALPLLLLAALAACDAAPSNQRPSERAPRDGDEGPTGTDDDAADVDGDGDEDQQPTSGLPAFARCVAAEACASGLTCRELGGSAYCVAPCAGGQGCDVGQRCVDNVCLREAGPYEICDAVSTCARDAFCHANAPAPTRCTPICEAGELASDYDEVASCPALPQDLDGARPSCTQDLLPGLSTRFCAAKAVVGGPCDEFALLCGSEDRFDTDLDQEAASPGAPDPGALRCLDDGEAWTCLRVCSVDGGVTESPCGCGDDPACEEPTSWRCEALPGGAAWLRVCLPN